MEVFARARELDEVDSKSMPDRRRRRGPHPQDEKNFSPAELPRLRRAASELAWLLGRGYPAKASVKLVGDRHALTKRQRDAIQRSSVGAPARDRRLASQRESSALAGRELWVDGYNVLLTVESGLGGGVVLGSADRTFRDMASMSGHYKKVEQTREALGRIGDHLESLSCAGVRWLLDRPISNSGRLKALMLGLAEERGWRWEVELSKSPDRELVEVGELIASADGWVLDHGGGWINLAREVVEARVPEAWVVDLFPAESQPMA